MAENKVKPKNFVVIQGWMISELGLKGNELLVYAIIYGFSQSENQKYSGSVQYLADWTKSSRQGIHKNLKALYDKGFIDKEEKYLNGVKFVDYWSTEFTGGVNKVDKGIKQSLQGGSKQSLHHNIDIHNKDKNIVDIIVCIFNETCLSLPKVVKLTDSRKKTINARLNEHSIEDIETVFKKAEASDFLTGKKTNWSADFDWLMKPNNFVKVLEGNYDNKETGYDKSRIVTGLWSTDDDDELPFDI